MNHDDELLKSVLDFDALDQAEKLELGEGGALALHLAKTKMARECLQAAGDTHFSMDLAEYQAVVEREGFRKVFERGFHSERHERSDTVFVYWHPDGMLLCFDTFTSCGATHVNGGDLLFNWRPNEGVSMFAVSMSGGMSRADTSVMVGSIDCREALSFHICQLRELGTLLTEWVERPFMWMYGYGEQEDQGKDFSKRDEFNRVRLSECGPEVLAMVGNR